jgi:fusion and transport protein UGO1
VEISNVTDTRKCFGVVAVARFPAKAPQKKSSATSLISVIFKISTNYNNFAIRHNPPKMTPSAVKRQRSAKKSDTHPSKKRKIKRQTDYHSSSSDNSDLDDDDVEEEELAIVPINQDAEFEDAENDGQPTGEEDSDSQSEDQDTNSDASDEEDNPNTVKIRKKRNDPTAFANSMSKILNSKLSVAKRADPVLSRSKDASAAVKETQEARLEAKAKQQIRDERRTKMDTGRIRDVMGLQDPNVSTEDIMAREKKLKKLSQQGVIRLFNAVLTAQMKGQEAARSTKQDGVVGMAKREEKVNEMSKQGFLDLIAGGGKK